MALRYVARRLGIPALRRASGPGVSPSAGSGPLASRSSQLQFLCSQAGYSNGGAAWKESSEEETLAKHKAEIDAAYNDIMRTSRIERRISMVAFAISTFLALYTVAAIVRKAGAMARERALAREFESFIAEADTDEADMDDVDMEGDERE